MPDIVCYTCILGGYDNLLRPSVVPDGVRFVCFTDNPSLSSDVWEIRPVPEGLDGLSTRKKTRYIKLHPHEVLGECDASVYVDANVKVVGDLSKFVESTVVPGKSVYIARHPDRDDIWDEERCIHRWKKDSPSNTGPQVRRYKDVIPRHGGLWQNSIILRIDDPYCRRLMDVWWSEIESYSYRDQLSLPYALTLCGMEGFETLGKGLFDSEYFKRDKNHKKKRRW